MQKIRSRLSDGTMEALLGLSREPGNWLLRTSESAELRNALVGNLLEGPNAEGELLDFIRDHKVPISLANCLLEAAEIPRLITHDQMIALRLKGEQSPIDQPVFRDQGCWRRTDMPIAAAPNGKGGWKTVSATY